MRRLVPGPLRLATALSFAVACAGNGSASVGALIARNNENHALRVVDVPPGMAAEKAGLLPGDEILMIDGFFVRDLTIQQIHELLRGEPGTTVELTIARGADVRRVSVVRSALRARHTEKKEEKLAE